VHSAYSRGGVGLALVQSEVRKCKDMRPRTKTYARDRKWMFLGVHKLLSFASCNARFAFLAHPMVGTCFSTNMVPKEWWLPSPGILSATSVKVIIDVVPQAGKVVIKPTLASSDRVLKARRGGNRVGEVNWRSLV
jgi:hypothetical protein